MKGCKFSKQELLGRKALLMCARPILYGILFEGQIHLFMHENTIMIQVVNGISVDIFLKIILFKFCGNLFLFSPLFHCRQYKLFIFWFLWFVILRKLSCHSFNGVFKLIHLRKKTNSSVSLCNCIQVYKMWMWPLSVHLWSRGEILYS